MMMNRVFDPKPELVIMGLMPKVLGFTCRPSWASLYLLLKGIGCLSYPDSIDLQSFNSLAPA